jgi:hypothetical protein
MFKFLNQSGLALVQSLVAGAVLLGVGAYVTHTMKNQEKLVKNVTGRQEADEKLTEISDVFTQSDICVATLSQVSDLTNAKLQAIKNKNGSTLYSIGQPMKGGTIEDMQVLNYIQGPGLRHHNVNLQIKVRMASADLGSGSSFGGKSINFNIPLYVITKNNVVKVCLSDTSETVESALRVACAQFGGTMDPITGVCQGVIGPDGLLVKYVKDYFCDSSGAGCKHAYSGKVCSGVDVRGAAHGNWVVSGFGGDGEMQCSCMPRACPDPGSYCVGTDLGTDWCSSNCPLGTYSPNDYGPDPGNVCHDETLVQTNSCGETRTVSGTMDCRVAGVCGGGLGSCSQGSSSGVSGSGPWTWSCDGSRGGSSDSCYEPAPPPPPDPCADAYVAATSQAGWFDQSGSEKIDYYNQNGISGSFLAGCGFASEADVQWMHNHGLNN